MDISILNDERNERSIERGETEESGDENESREKKRKDGCIFSQSSFLYLSFSNRKWGERHFVSFNEL